MPIRMNQPVNEISASQVKKADGYLDELTSSVTITQSISGKFKETVVVKTSSDNCDIPDIAISGWLSLVKLTQSQLSLSFQQVIDQTGRCISGSIS